MAPLSPDTRIAIVGGLGALKPLLTPYEDRLLIYGSHQERGNGDIHRLREALRHRRIHRVYVLTRWISHSASQRVQQHCRLARVPCVLWPRGLSSLCGELRS